MLQTRGDMTIRRLALLAATLVVAAVAASAASPSQAHAYGCSGVPAKAPVVYKCDDPWYEGRTCVNTENDMYSAYCIEEVSVDPDNICVSYDTCITGLEDNINYLKGKVGELDDPVYAYAAYVLGVVNGLVDDVNDILDDPICVTPFDPTRPICVT